MRTDCLSLPSLHSRTLVIAFTSYGTHGVPARSFEWVNTVSALGVHGLYFRDTFQHWFHAGCRGYSASLEHSVLLVEAYIASHSIEKVITIGSSMGGHGALLFGALLGVDHVIAFSPQVNMDHNWLLPHGDLRWQLKASEINHSAYDYLNLAELLHSRRPKETSLFYDSAVGLDELHARTLQGLPGVELTDLRKGEHEVAYVMAKAGEVTRLLGERITNSGDALVLRQHVT